MAFIKYTLSELCPMYIFAGTLFGKRDDNIEYKSKNDTLSQLTIEMLMERQC